MATKNQCLLSKQQSFVNDNSNINNNDSQYSNLNLNQNLNSSNNVSPVQSFSKSFNGKSCDSVGSESKNGNEKSESWKKSSKTSKFHFSNDESKKAKKSWKKGSINNSTLSLHISAYENSNEDVASDLFLNGEDFKKNGQKQIFADSSTFMIQNPFEFPRQQNSNGTDPEVSQYSGSQRLLNPNGIVPPFLSQSTKTEGSGSPVVKAPRFVQVDPTQVKFQLAESGPTKKTLQLTNVCGLRIAWRIRSNAPTRYVVNPACGFLTSNEAQTIQIELTDSNKYSERHRFMVQAMEAKDDEKDRRKIWEDNRATQLDLVQCFRVFTIGMGSVTDQSIMSIITKTLCTPGAGASASNTSVASSDGVTATTSVASSATSSTSATSSSSGTSSSGSETTSTTSGSNVSAAAAVTASLTEYSDRIGELTVLAKNNLAAKEQVSQKMVQAVNEVKRIEVELDRAGQQSSELDGRQKSLVAQVEQLEKRSKQLDDELKAALTAKDKN